MKKQKIITLRILTITLSVAVMVVIFLLSADNADESNAKSDIFADSFVYNVLAVFDLTDEQIQRVIDTSVFIVRKTAHFAEYAALGFLLYSVCVSFYVKPVQGIPISFAGGTLYAVSDEIHQYFVPGRACQLRDVLIDASGVISGIAVLFLLVLIYKYINKKKKQSLSSRTLKDKKS